MSDNLLHDHVSDEDLIRALDGELSRTSRLQVESHLDACWGCRHRQQRYGEAIGRFTEFEIALTARDEAQPPAQWRGFEGRLLRASDIPTEIAPRPQGRRMVLGLVAVAVIAAWLWPAPPLSAKDVLHRGAQSEQDVLRRATDRVLLQKVRIESRSRRAEAAFWIAPGARHAHRQWVTSDAGIGAEVEGVYARHGMSFQQPVSVANHQAWRDTVPQREDEVEENGDYLRLRTRCAEPVLPGQIQEAELLVRTSDWHAVEQTFLIAGAADRYRIVETSYELKPLTNEIARLFTPAAPQPEAAPTLLATLGPIVTPPLPEAEISPLLLPAPPDPRRLVESELEARAIVRELEADRREAARVETQPQAIQVTLYPSDAQRARLLTTRLQAVPDVQVVIHSLDDAPAAMPATTPAVEIETEASEAPLFLRDLVTASGSLHAANLVVSRHLDLLRRMKTELNALADLTSHFPTSREADLTDPARARLRALQQSYFDGARHVWQQLTPASPLFLQAMGVASPAAAQPAPATHSCAWPQTAADLAFGARRLEELYSRAFTTVAGADTSLRWMSRGALREETAALSAALAHSFSDTCRP
jgi:anti-sigma factor ChrR (cupin superfamily)